MKTLYSLFKTDSNKENGEGIQLDYGVAKIMIHRAGGSNRKYKKAYQALLAEHGRSLEADAIAEEDSERLYAGLYADTVITGWEGVTDATGKPLEFTRDNVVKLLLDLPELFFDIRKAALDVALFKNKEKQTDLGN